MYRAQPLCPNTKASNKAKWDPYQRFALQTRGGSLAPTFQKTGWLDFGLAATKWLPLSWAGPGRKTLAGMFCGCSLRRKHVDQIYIWCCMGNQHKKGMPFTWHYLPNSSCQDFMLTLYHTFYYSIGNKFGPVSVCVPF